MRYILTVVSVVILSFSSAPASAATQQEQSSRILNELGHRCLDAAWEGIGGNGTRVQLWDCYGPGQLNQQWYFRNPDPSDPLATQIVNKASGRCLDATYQSGGVNGTPLQLWDCYGPGQLNQIWYLDYAHPYVNMIIRSKMYRRVADAAWQWQGANGTPVQLWDFYGVDRTNQRWGLH
ncbi:RICIN domain-containing protein [Allorhizocola rhizosphaerae]|uniref:RICIN domain-containing protein n=1 Tax=Allorhizocola rhizosphaerae TaxID=1872709 RepID=UPI000E3E3B40|nr:RICIN domain-containing protein [Allorhizocola rhizosphaerae]